MKPIRSLDPISTFIVLAFIVVDITAWWTITTGYHTQTLRMYRLTGSSTTFPGNADLLVFPGGTSMLFDSGADQKTLMRLEDVLPPDQQSIDVAVIPEPDIADFGGYLDILDHYHIGAFVYNGRNADEDVSSWHALIYKIERARIPLITIAKGDRIRYGNTTINVLAPDQNFVKSPDLAETRLRFRAALYNGR